MKTGQLRGVHASLLALIGVAMLVRALVPMGWMPVRSADGFAIELCAGLNGDPRNTEAANSLLKTALAGSAQSGDDHGDHPESGDPPPCTFAGLTPFVPPTKADVLAAPAPIAAPALPFALVGAIGRGLPAPPPPATGPPLRA